MFDPILVPPSRSAADPRPLPEIIANGKPDPDGWSPFPLASHDVEGKRYYAVQDWLVGVAQVAEPRKFWISMKQRLKKAGIELDALCVSLPYRATNGKPYQMNFTTTKGLYLITRRMAHRTGIRDLILGEGTRPANTSGHVYILHFEQCPNEYKIGIAADLEKRMRLYRTENPPSMRMIVDCAFYYVNCRAIEKQIHAALKEYWIRGEWFSLTAKQVPTIEHWLFIRSVEDEETVQNEQLSFEQARQIVYTNSQFIGKQAAETGKRLGIDVATQRRLLKDQESE